MRPNALTTGPRLRVPTQTARALPDAGAIPLEDEPDPTLLPWLTAQSAEAEGAALAALITQVEPRIRSVMRERTRLFAGPGATFSRRDEERSEAVYRRCAHRILEHLQRLKSDPDPGPPPPLEEVAESVARSEIADYLRNWDPARAGLRSQLLYLMRHEVDLQTGRKQFAVWEIGGDQVCGLEKWEGTRPGATRRHALCRSSPAVVKREALGADDVSAEYLGTPLLALFRWLGAPAAFEDAAAVMAEARGLSGSPELPAEPIPSTESREAVEARLRRVWEAVTQLPAAQAAAFLLSAGDEHGRGVVDLLPALGIASVRQIAAVVGLTPERLAELWPRLPLEDGALAELMGSPRGRVAVWRWRARRQLHSAVAGA